MATSSAFSREYDDSELTALVEQALIDDPKADPGSVKPMVENGVISLQGTVTNEAYRLRAVRIVRDYLDAAGADYDRIEDKIAVS